MAAVDGWLSIRKQRIGILSYRRWPSAAFLKLNLQRSVVTWSVVGNIDAQVVGCGGLARGQLLELSKAFLGRVRERLRLREEVSLRL